VAVDLFEAYFPRWFNRAVDVISALTGAAIFVAMAWAVSDSAKISAMLNLQTNLLPLKKLWFQNALSVLALVTAFGMFLRAIELALTGRDVQKEAQV